MHGPGQRKVAGPVVLSTSRAEHVEDGVQQQSHRPGPGPPRARWIEREGLDQCHFALVRHVA